ncbi:MAG: DUF1292 domain-containing protein [Lachnospiraceae bacterium]|nr:DUF1292 domain-containing protein [Lachnospiraceae bacterium]
MEKITFTFSDTKETVEFFVLEQTKFQGCQYLLVTDGDEEDEEAEAYIFKDLSRPEDKEAVYEMVEEDQELEAVSQIFSELLENVELKMEQES